MSQCHKAMKQSIINTCLMLLVYFLVDKLRRLIAYQRITANDVTDDWQSFSDKSLSISTSNLSGVGIIVDCPMLPAGALVANAIVHSNSTLGRYTGMYFTVTYWGAHINHGIHSNTVLTEVFEGYSLQTTKSIPRGEELLIDYVTLPYFTCPPSPLWDFEVLVQQEKRIVEFALRCLVFIFYSPQCAFM